MFSALEQSCCQKLLVNGTLTGYGDPFYGEMMGVFTIFQVNVQTVSVRAFSAAPDHKSHTFFPHPNVCKCAKFLKINLPKFRFIESLHHTAILKNLNFCANSARSKTWSRKNISWTEMKCLLTKPSNVLPSYTSSQNSNLLYSEVDFLKRS